MSPIFFFFFFVAWDDEIVNYDDNQKKKIFETKRNTEMGGSGADSLLNLSLCLVK